ncbi:WG repeat-containing protein [Algivirga pacifica]|uniref:WG containing repeat-containing protein n=1 Tax=Algivirga pacifica TaxID=1162670 RepID=A0ABP9DIJ5_9BACT
MKKLMLFLVAALFFNLAWAQEQQLIPFRNGNIWGATDKEKNEVIPFNYQEVSFFSDKYYKVKIEGKEGIMNGKGKYLLQPIYDLILPVNDTLFQVMKGGKTGLCTFGDKEILPIQYTKLRQFTDTPYFSAELNKKFGVVDIHGKELIKIDFDGVSHFQEDYFLIRRENQYMLVNKEFQSVSGEFYDDIAPLDDTYILTKRGKLWGCMRVTGEKLIPAQYERIKLLPEAGYFQVIRDQKYGLFDMTGKEVLAPAFEEEMHFFKGEYCWIEREGKWQMLNLKKDAFEPLPYTTVIDSLYGYVRVMKGDKMVLINRNMEEVAPARYYQVKPYNDQVHMVELEKKWGFITLDGEEVVAPQYDEIFDAREKGKKSYAMAMEFDRQWDMPTSRKQEEEEKIIDNEGVGKVANGNQWALVDSTGQALTEARYSNIGIVSRKHPLWMEVNGKYGALSQEGKQLVAPIYDGIEYKGLDQLFKIEKDGKVGLLDQNGKSVLLPQYSLFHWTTTRGRYLVGNEGKWGLINRKGETLIAMEYQRLFDMEGYLLGIKDGQATLFDSNGNVVISPKYTHIESMRDENREVVEGLFKVRQGYREGVVNTKGVEVVPAVYERVAYRNGLLEVFQNKNRGYYNTKGVKYFAE